MYFLPGALKGSSRGWRSRSRASWCWACWPGHRCWSAWFGCYLGGVLSDRHIRRTGDRRHGPQHLRHDRLRAGGVFYLLAAGTQLLVPELLIPLAVMLMLVGFANDLMMAPAWAVSQDCGREYAATVSGAMNMVGNLGAALGIWVTGLLLLEFGENPAGFVVLFTLYGVIYFAGVVAWSLIDATKPIVPDPEAESP